MPHVTDAGNGKGTTIPATPDLPHRLILFFRRTLLHLLQGLFRFHLLLHLLGRFLRLFSHRLGGLLRLLLELLRLLLHLFHRLFRLLLVLGGFPPDPSRREFRADAEEHDGPWQIRTNPVRVDSWAPIAPSPFSAKSQAIDREYFSPGLS